MHVETKPEREGRPQWSIRNSAVGNQTQFEHENAQSDKAANK